MSDKTMKVIDGRELTKADGPRDDWEIPEPPECDCSEPDVKPVAYADVKEWCLHWTCFNCEGWLGSISWPFEDDEFVDDEMLEELGFEIV